MECFGCKLANGEIETYVVYEDEYVMCILDTDTCNYGQALILPVDHFKELDDIDSYTLNAVSNTSYVVSEALKIVFNTNEITTCHNSGELNGMGHYHLRVIPRFNDDDSLDLYDLKDKILRVLGKRDY